MTFATAPAPYRRSACTTTDVNVTPSAFARDRAASSTSRGMRNGVVGVSATTESGLQPRGAGLHVTAGSEALGVCGVGLILTSGETCLQAGYPLAAVVDLLGPLGLCHGLTVSTPVSTVKPFGQESSGGS